MLIPSTVKAKGVVGVDADTSCQQSCTTCERTSDYCRSTICSVVTYCTCVFSCCAILPISMTHQQQPAPTITSKLEVLGALARATELSTFGCHNSSVQLLVDYILDAGSNKQRRRMLLLEHNLLYQLSAAAAKALQLIGQASGLAQATDDTLATTELLCASTRAWIVEVPEAATGVSAATGEYRLQG